MDWHKAKLVGLFICKHGSSNRLRYLIANHIAKEATTSKKIKPDEFVLAIKPILKMAAIKFTKTVFETKFMDVCYDDADFKKLENGIEDVCKDLKHSVFGEATEIEKKDWIHQVLMPDLEWLSKFDSIREKVHKAAGVPLLHINEQEAKKLLDRLQKEQDRVREQALHEELEVKQREQVLLNYLEP